MTDEKGEPFYGSHIYSLYTENGSFRWTKEASVHKKQCIEMRQGEEYRIEKPAAYKTS